jgi:hypothetical protein
VHSAEFLSVQAPTATTRPCFKSHHGLAHAADGARVRRTRDADRKRANRSPIQIEKCDNQRVAKNCKFPDCCLNKYKSRISKLNQTNKNLDVNLAVNNLLQRDDEGDEGGEDDDPYIHAGGLLEFFEVLKRNHGLLSNFFCVD